jgi:MFS family permease
MISSESGIKHAPDRRDASDLTEHGRAISYLRAIRSEVAALHSLQELTPPPLVIMSALRTSLSATWAALHTLQYGFHISALNGIQDAVTCSSGHIGTDSLSPDWVGSECVAMDVSIRELRYHALIPQDGQFGLVVSIFTLGGLVGSVLANSIIARVGRIWTLRVSAACIFLGSTLVGLANSIPTMIIGR